MNWQQVLEDKSLQDLPYKIELNAAGQIVMSPAKNKHSFMQGTIHTLLVRMASSGCVMPEIAIVTSENVKVADVAWASDERSAVVKDQDACSIAPELCVEVQSPGNADSEMQHKVSLYLAAGAIESWICNESGNVRFFDASGELNASKLFPSFPTKITL